jgi:tripartite-type tricarboxylate transporter receptor subunit TctC
VLEKTINSQGEYKEMKRKIFGLAAALATSSVAFTAPAIAADIPCSTAKLIVPWAPGGDTDLVFQVVARAINETGFKPQLQIVHISGQSGNKAAKEVKGSKPDGCTLMAMHESQITTYLAGRVDFTWDAFAPVALLTYTPSVLGANSKAPFDDMKTLVAYAKKNPGKLGVGVTTGSTSQFFNLVVEDQTGTEFKYIPYEGTRERLTAILSHNVDIGEMNILTAKKYIQEGSMKALGIATEKRDPLMPELPTMKEQGVDVIYGLNRGVVAPKGTPADVIKHYEAAFAAAMKNPAVVKHMDDAGTWIVYKDAAGYKSFLETSFAQHLKVAKKIGMFKG